MGRTRSHRARRLTVRVFHTGRVEVVVPSRTSALTVERFVERHRIWIERKREEHAPAPFRDAISQCRLILPLRESSGVFISRELGKEWPDDDCRWVARPRRRYQ